MVFQGICPFHPSDIYWCEVTIFLIYTESVMMPPLSFLILIIVSFFCDQYIYIFINFIDSLKESTSGFINFSIFVFFVFLFHEFTFWSLLFPFSFLLWSYFLSFFFFLRLKVIDLRPYFLIQVFKTAVNFPLSIPLVATHKFLYVIFNFHAVQNTYKYLKNFLNSIWSENIGCMTRIL